MPNQYKNYPNHAAYVVEWRQRQGRAGLFKAAAACRRYWAKLGKEAQREYSRAWHAAHPGKRKEYRDRVKAKKLARQAQEQADQQQGIR